MSITESNERLRDVRTPSAGIARRLAVLIVAVLALAGLAAQPASAAEGGKHSSKGNTTEISFLGALHGHSEVVQVPTGEKVILSGGWATLTAEQRDQFVETAIVEVERNGVAQPFETGLRTDVSAPNVPGGLLSYSDWSVTAHPQSPNEPEVWTLRITLTADHFDGSDLLPAGTVLQASRTIVWTQRGHFPSADYPCPNGQDPCVDG